MSRRYRMYINLSGVKFRTYYGGDVGKLSEKARKLIEAYQKDVARNNDGKFWIAEDVGERRMVGAKNEIVWKKIKEEKVPYKVRPDFSIGDILEEDDTERRVVVVDYELNEGFDGIQYTLKHEDVSKKIEKRTELQLKRNWVKL